MNLKQTLYGLENKITDLVETRFHEFETLGRHGSNEELFSELCFCVMTANWTAKGGMKIQSIVGPDGFAYMSEDELTSTLRQNGHRFWRTRAKYICANRWFIKDVKSILDKPAFECRKYLAENLMGLGWKEASHFLRNTGAKDIAILDKHILKLMMEDGLIDQLPKNGWTEKKYLSHEGILRNFSEGVGHSLGKLDLYLWYIAKGSVDK